MGIAGIKSYEEMGFFVSLAVDSSEIPLEADGQGVCEKACVRRFR